MEDEYKIEKKKLFKIGIVILIVVITLIIFGATKFFVTGNVISGFGSDENVQIVKLKVVGSSYILEPSSFKVGVPVRIEADMSTLYGCSQSIVISAFNVRKTVSSEDNIIEFTPTKAGTFNIACSMNMYRGTFSVLDAEGKKSNYQEPAQIGGSCGSGGGGCGCGG